MNAVKPIIIEGRVLPERRSVTIACLENISYKDHKGFEAEFGITITNSKIRIECTPHSLTESNLQECVVRAYEFVTATVDLYAFSKAWALEVILDDLIVADQRQGIAFGETSAAPYCTTLSSEKDFLETLPLLFSNFNLRFAFRDLITSLSTLNYSAIAACRALEAIRKSIAPESCNDRESWQILREKLQIERSYIQFITDASLEPRHGNRGSAIEYDQLKITHRVWKIMDRYIEYLKRGSTGNLPEDEFPPLIE